MWNSDPAGQLERLADYLNNLDAVDEDSNETPVVDQMMQLHDDYMQMARRGEHAARTLMNLECDVTGNACSLGEDGDFKLKCCNPCRVWQEALFPRYLPLGKDPPTPESPKLTLVPDPG